MSKYADEIKLECQRCKEMSQRVGVDGREWVIHNPNKSINCSQQNRSGNNGCFLGEVKLRSHLVRCGGI